MAAGPNSSKRRQLDQLLAEMAATQIKGRDLSCSDRMEQLRELSSIGGLQTLEPMLPLCLNLQGKPYALKDHYPFSPIFKTQMPRQLVYKTARQVSKSTSMASHGIMLSACIPYFRTLYICPLYEQIRRFSNNYVRPFIDLSPVKPLWCSTSTESSVLQRSFRNQAVMLFSFAYTDVDRIRGVSADCVRFDEIQDADPSHLPIIREVMSYSPYELFHFTGTPKSLDNPIEGLWQRSSMAEWFVPCHHGGCGHWNIPSMDYDVAGMIGPWHQDISEKIPGTICVKCQKPIYPRNGRWVHRYPEKRFDFAGYHVPQIIMPLHFARPDKWSTLLAKREGAGNTTQATFYNEVLGESVDVGQKLVTETELKKASVLPWKNSPTTPDPALIARLPAYQTRLLAIDWGGGGQEGVSFTVAALLGFTPAGHIHCLWGKRFVISQDHLREAKELLHWLQVFRCHLVAHDYTGAGVVRETVMVQAGFDLDRVMAVQLQRAATAALIRYVEPSVLHPRAHYRLDKVRSLLYTCQAIKLGMLQFFEYDFKNNDDAGLIRDFLALVEEKTESRAAGDIYTITRNTFLSDDFAQAVNIGCAGLWHTNQAWPNFADAAAVGRLTSTQVLAAGSRDYGWNEDTASRFMGMPGDD